MPTPGLHKALHAGKLTGVKWGNWCLLRSEVLKPGLRFYVGKGGHDLPRVGWSEPADAFIMLTAAVGYSPEAAAQLMGGQRGRLAWTGKRVAYRLATLKRSGRIPRLIRERGLNVRCRRGRLFAEWKECRWRLRGLARAMSHRKEGQPLTGQELAMVRRVAARLGGLVWAADPGPEPVGVDVRTRGRGVAGSATSGCRPLYKAALIATGLG